MKTIIIVLLGMILVIISHEIDIARVCAEQGNSGYAMWTTKINCSPYKTN